MQGVQNQRNTATEQKRRGTHLNSFSGVGDLAVQGQLYPGPRGTPCTAEQAAFSHRGASFL